MITKEDIKKIFLFSSLDDSLADKIISTCVLKSADASEIIFLEDDKALGFYAVLEGMVKVYKISFDGKEQILHIFKQGDIFGEVPVFLNTPFPACASSISEAKLLFFKRDLFVSLFKSEPDISLSLIAALSSKLNKFVNLVETISLKEVPSRFANYIIAQSAREKNSMSFELDISKTLLSSIIGTIPETLSRVLKRLKDSNILVSSGTSIKILNMEKLRLIAKGEEKL